MFGYGIRLKIPAVTSHKTHFPAMKKIDEEILDLCALQAEVFAASLTVTQCSSPGFIRRFMNSEVATRIDRRGFLLETCDVTSIFNEVETQYGPTSYGKERYGREELYWPGYLYRYWTYTYEKSSKQVYKQMKPKDLRKLYYPYHSLNPAQAIERILEGSGSNEDDYTEKGVQILRGILEREKSEQSITEPPTRTKDRGGGFMWVQNRINLSYDKLYAKINLTYDKRKDIIILR